MLKPHTTADALYRLSDGSFRYRGYVDHLIRYVEERYLCNPDTWTEFVRVFHKHTDEDGWNGEFWGKMMRGSVLTYRYTSNEKLYAVLTETARDMLSAQRENGAFSTYTADNAFCGWDIWCRKYVLLGFEYYLEICKDDILAKQIVAALCRHADAVMERVGNPADGKIPITKACDSWLGLPASSILEPFVKLYTLTGEERYLDFASYIVENGGMEGGSLWEEAYRGEKAPYQYRAQKAYEMMSCFEGLIAYYRVTGNDYYKTAAVNFAKKIMESDLTIIGSAGCQLELFDNSTRTQLDTENCAVMQETCVTVTWMKLCYQLLLLTGEPVFADKIELAAYNAMPGAVNDYGITDAIEGMPFDSYSPLMYSTRARLSAGYRELEHIRYGCCGCIGSAGTALMALASAMKAKDGVYVNLYYPGDIHTEAPSGNPITLSVDTRYPNENTVKITFVSETSEKMKIAVRVPAYSKINAVSVSGEKPVSAKAGYYVVDRLWKNGDTIDLDFDTRVRVFRTEGVDENSKYHIALYKGPVVLAMDARLCDIDAVADVVEDESGFVEYQPSQTANFPVNMEYRIQNKDGSFFTVIDYASAGKTYDRDSVMTAWIATKNYWKVDFDKRFVLADRLVDGKRYLFIDDEKYVHACHSVAKATGWKTEDTGDGYVRLEDGSGRYLTVAGDDPMAYASAKPYAEDDCQKWKILHFARNYYILIHKKTGCALYEDSPNFKYMLFATEDASDKRYISHLRNNNLKVNVLFYVKNREADAVE